MSNSTVDWSVLGRRNNSAVVSRGPRGVGTRVCGAESVSGSTADGLPGTASGLTGIKLGRGRYSWKKKKVCYCFNNNKSSHFVFIQSAALLLFNTE